MGTYGRYYNLLFDIFPEVSVVHGDCVACMSLFSAIHGNGMMAQQ